MSKVRGTLNLRKPIKINGTDISTITYDSEEITVDLYNAACAHSVRATTIGGAPTPNVKEVDYSMHLHLGMAAVIAINPSIDWADLKRMKGKDILNLTNIGAFFMFGASAEPSQESNSAKQSESTPGTSTQMSEA